MLIILIIIVVLCIASVVCYEVSDKLLQTKTAERSAKKAALKKKSKKWYDKELKKLNAKSKSKPKQNDEFNVGYAFETIELIEDLTDKIHLLRKVKKISFNMVFVCSILLVVVILLGAVAYVLTVKAGAR